MSKKNITIMTLVGLVLVFSIWALFNFFSPTGSLNKTKSIVSFEVNNEQNSLILKARNIDHAKVKAIPTGTGITEGDYQDLGEMEFVSDTSGLQIWNLPIPKVPLSVSEVFLVAYDEAGVEVGKQSLPYVGATDIYNALWLSITFKEVTLAVGESFKFDGYNFTFSSVKEDGRCPIDVQCIQAGRVMIDMAVLKDGKKEIITLSSDEGKKRIGNYNLSIVSVLPEQIAGQKVADKDYQISLYITKVSL